MARAIGNDRQETHPVVVSFNDPANKESLLDREDACYAYRDKEGKWAVRAKQPVFKKSLFRSIRDKVSGGDEKP